MTTIATTHPFVRTIAVARPRTAAGPGIVRRAAEAVRRFWVQRQTRIALESQPDVVLKDIGVGRSEIDAIAEAVADYRAGTPRRRPRPHR